MIDWNAKNVAQLLDPLICHHKAGLVGRNYHEEALRLINKHWVPAIAAFFHTYHENKKILHQFGQITRESFSYANTCLVVNSRIVKKILSRQSTPRTAFKTWTCNWHQLETLNSPPVPFARLALANLYYGSFGDLLERLLPTNVHGYTGLYYYSQYG